MACNNAGPTILQVLYYLSWVVTELPNLPETNSLGSTVEIPAANYKSPVSAPQVGGEGIGAGTRARGGQASTGRGAVQYILRTVDGEAPKLVFEPRVTKNQLRRKTFLIEMISKGMVVGKVWDGLKRKSDVRDHEAEAYLKLQPLWGKCIPRLIRYGEIDFLWGIFLERIEVD